MMRICTWQIIKFENVQNLVEEHEWKVKHAAEKNMSLLSMIGTIIFVVYFSFICCCYCVFGKWYFWTGFPRFMRWYICDENRHNTTVFRLRIVNCICTSSDEKVT
jgi:hypothetical protein